MNENQKDSLPESYFNDVYAVNDDPWDFEKSEYEAEKYQTTIDSLPRDVYANAFEIGCSIGVLTEKLAAKCKKLLSVDVSEKALDKAKVRCNHLPQITFAKMSIPEQFPDEKFDLILISEVGYYLSPADWQAAMDKVYAHLEKKGQVGLVHWLPLVHDYPQTGDEVHDAFAKFAEGKMKRVNSTKKENYRLDTWEKL